MKGPPRLQELRERRLLSRNELSQMTGVRLETISRLESGEGGAWPRTIRKLADALEVSYDELFEEPTSAPLARAATGTDPGERQLLAEVRPLALLMDEQSERWEEMVRSTAVGSALHREVLGKRERVLEAADGLLGALSDEGHLDWENPAHRPSRRARQELQGAFNRWTRAFFAVMDAYLDGLSESERVETLRIVQEREQESRLSPWLDRRAS